MAGPPPSGPTAWAEALGEGQGAGEEWGNGGGGVGAGGLRVQAARVAGLVRGWEARGGGGGGGGGAAAGVGGLSEEFLERQAAAAERRAARGRGRSGVAPWSEEVPGRGGAGDDDFSPSINARSRALAAKQGGFEERQRAWREARGERLRLGREAAGRAAEVFTFKPQLCPRSLSLLDTSRAAGEQGGTPSPGEAAGRRRRQLSPASGGSKGAGRGVRPPAGGRRLQARGGGRNRPHSAPAPRREDCGASVLQWKMPGGLGEFRLPGGLSLLLD